MGIYRVNGVPIPALLPYFFKKFVNGLLIYVIVSELPE